MPLATASNLSKTYAGQRIFQGVSFEIQERDRIALVGANGAGKTTLLRILGGLERSDSGGMAFATGTRLGFLSQEVTFPPGVTLRQHILSAFKNLLDIETQMERLQDQLAASGGQYGSEIDVLLLRHDRLQHDYEVGGGYTYQNRMREVLAGLGIEEERLDQPLETFSGGQRTRVALAELLLSSRDLLLLDEPTNHLDLEATEWLEEFLAQAPQAAVIISHDRWFLDKVAKRTWEMAFGKLERFTGNYSQFAEQRAERQERQRKEFEAQKRHVEKTEAFIDRYRAGQRSRQARGRQKLLDRLERVERPRESGAMALTLRSTLRSGETVVATEKLTVAVGTPKPETVQAQPGMPVVREASGRATVPEEAILFRADDIELRRGDRAAIIGPNGTGKTTFLRIVNGELEPATGRLYIGYGVQLAYYAQAHEQLRPTRTVIQEIVDVKPLGEEAARTYLGRFLFSGDDVFKQVGTLSGGERSRLALAKLALGNANFLVLDEPTNHLDIYSREALEAVLREFNGTVLFVSHDRYLIDALATQIWSVDDHALKARKMTWAEYQVEREQARVAREGAERRAKVASAAPALVSQSEARTQTREVARKQARLLELEQEIATLTAQLHLLSNQIETASVDADAASITQLGRQHETATAALHEREYGWLNLKEELELVGAPDKGILDAMPSAGYRSSR